MIKEELKLTSKEALKRLEMVLNWSGDIDIDNIQTAYNILKSDLKELKNEYKRIQ